MKKFICVALAMSVGLCASCRNSYNTKALKSGIAVTYANDVQMDGAGAQLQRVYGIYALSRFLGLPYVHTPLKRIGYQGLTALENDSLNPNEQDKWNRVFTIPSDIELPENTIVKYVHSPTVENITRLKMEAEKENSFYLLRMLYPYDVTDKNPESYRCVRKISPFKAVHSDIFRIAIHVRRGEEFAVESSRMLPNSYYIASTMNVIGALRKLGIPFVCDLYTEVPSKAFLVTPEHQGIKGVSKITKPVLIDPKMNQLEDFDVIPNLRKRINGDPIEALEGMATADTLIISRSSFSYLAALFSEGIVIYFPFWHQPLKDWLAADQSGTISSDEILERVQCWKRAHS
jgi:hypothetical protein